MRSLTPGLLAAFLLATSSLFAGVSLTFEDVEEFTDFTIHGLFQQEQAKALMEKQIQSFWNRRMKRLLPKDTALELHFTDIDMAGEMRSYPQYGQSHTRITQDQFPPRLQFNYKITAPDGTLVAEGSEDLIGKSYMFRTRRTPPPGEVTFFYEMELLYAWLKGLDVDQKGKS
jgi:hypothetical protein